LSKQWKKCRSGKNFERRSEGDKRHEKSTKVQGLEATKQKSNIQYIMSYRLTSAAGNIEAVIDDNCGMNKFLSIANMLEKEHKIKFIAKEDNSDTIDWYFRYKGRDLRLHYSIYNGVSICNRNIKDNDAVTQLATSLEKKFF
jgi:hypothetical protein